MNLNKYDEHDLFQKTYKTFIFRHPIDFSIHTQAFFYLNDLIKKI